MKKICRFAAGVALCAALTACADQPPQLTSKPGTIHVYEPKTPPGLAGPGEFSLSADGKITVNQREAKPAP
ncbi:hypothetical protein [Paraburkholderia xenovorans]